MKNKILALGLVLALVAVMVMPIVVSASNTGTVTVNGDVPGIPTLTSLSTNNGTPNPTAGLVVDISETLTGSGFVQGSDFSITISGVGVTADTIAWVSATQLTATFHIAAGPTTTKGVRTVTVTQSGSTSTDIVNFTVNGYISITAPAAVNLGVMTKGADATGNSTASSPVDTNDASWQVSAADAKGAANGYMNTLANGTGTSLQAAFLIGYASPAATLADSSHGITYTSGNGGTNLPFFVKQHVASNETAGSYQITITFTGSTP